MKLLIDVNQLLWNGPILVMLFGTHVYFTLRLRLVQRKIGYGISLSLSDGSAKAEEKINFREGRR